MAWERIQSVDEDVQILHYVMIGCYAATKILFMKSFYTVNFTCISIM